MQQEKERTVVYNIDTGWGGDLGTTGLVWFCLTAHTKVVMYRQESLKVLKAPTNDD